MPPPRLVLLTALAVALGAPADAQSLRDRLGQGVSRIGEGVGGIAGRIEGSVQDSADLMRNEPTPEATRDELDAMAAVTLIRLFREQPRSWELFRDSAGYAIFDTRKVVLLGLAAGAGRGVAVSKTGDRRVYMNMGTAGVGVAFGLGGFEAQVVILFRDPWDFDTFVTRGYDATAQAGTLFGSEFGGLGAHFIDGRAIFVLTSQGWKVSATAAGTRYWADGALN